eukprot:1855935-Prymnesium_polylepis.1
MLCQHCRLDIAPGKRVQQLYIGDAALHHPWERYGLPLAYERLHLFCINRNFKQAERELDLVERGYPPWWKVKHTSSISEDTCVFPGRYFLVDIWEVDREVRLALEHRRQRPHTLGGEVVLFEAKECEVGAPLRQRLRTLVADVVLPEVQLSEGGVALERCCQCRRTLVADVVAEEGQEGDGGVTLERRRQHPCTLGMESAKVEVQRGEGGVALEHRRQRPRNLDADVSVVEVQGDEGGIALECRCQRPRTLVADIFAAQ